MSEHNNAHAVPQGYEIHEIPADYSGLVWLEGQVRAVASRAQAATGPQGWTDADSDAARLALELECLLMDTKNLSVVSKWWDSANDALELHRQRLAATPAAAPAQDEPYTTIDLGHGKWEVGAGHNGGLPCIAFGRNGTGNVGEIITTAPRQMSVEETFAVITFANVTGLDVLQEQMDQVREEFFPGTTPQFAATPAPGPAHDAVAVAYRETITGRLCDPQDDHRLRHPLCYRPLVFGDTLSPAPAKEVGLTDEQKTWAVNQLMEQAQVFASAWSLVGGKFDFGNALEEAEFARNVALGLVRNTEYRRTLSEQTNTYGTGQDYGKHANTSHNIDDKSTAA